MLPSLAEVPFPSERKMMSVVVEGEEGPVVFSKGAPEVLLERCTRVWSSRGAEPASDEEPDRVLRDNDELAAEGSRVLGLACRKGGGDAAEDIERDLVFLGWAGLVASLAGYLPLTAVQILWINLMPDSGPAVALGVDPSARGLMERPPRRGGILGFQMLARIGTMGLVIAMVVLASFPRTRPVRSGDGADHRVHGPRRPGVPADRRDSPRRGNTSPSQPMAGDGGRCQPHTATRAPLHPAGRAIRRGPARTVAMGHHRRRLGGGVHRGAGSHPAGPSMVRGAVNRGKSEPRQGLHRVIASMSAAAADSSLCARSESAWEAANSSSISGTLGSFGCLRARP
jgi:Cation transporting ATPase, C-terminus/Cation transport ATPase (P-type)